MVSNKVKQPVAANPRFFYGYVVVAASFFISLVIYGMQYSFGIFFKPILQEFGWTRAVTAGAYSLSWLVMGLASIVMGRLNDKFGPRIVMSICGGISGIGFMLMSCISTVWHLYLVYGIIIGAGISVWVPLMSTIARWFVKRRTTMSGIVGAGIGIGTLIGSPVANSLISAFDWRLSYTILGGVVLVIIVGSAQLLRGEPKQMGQMAYGAVVISEEGHSQIEKSLSLREALNTKQFWLILFMLFCFGLCFQSIVAHLVPHITDLGITAASAAASMATIGGVSIVSKVVLGGLGDRIGNRNTLVIAFVLVVLALIWLFFAREMWQFYLFAVIFGFGYGGHIAQQSPLVGAIFGLVSHGLIFGIVGIGMSVGSAIGPVMTGFIFDVTGNYQLAFIVTTIVSAVGLILTIFLNSKITRLPAKESVAGV